MGDNLTAVNFGTGRHAIHVQAGPGSTCAILDDNSTKCWGINLFGKLGLDIPGTYEDPSKVDDIDFGRNRSAKSITVGDGHICAILAGLNVATCWGYNRDGQLGLGDTENRGDDPGEMGDALTLAYLGSFCPLCGSRLLPPPTIDCGSIQIVEVNNSCVALMPNVTDTVRLIDTFCAVNISQSHPPGMPLSGLGSRQVILTAEDEHGRQHSCNLEVVTRDDTGPTMLKCPALEHQVFPDSDTCKYQVPDFTNATEARDNCDGQVEATQYPAQGSALGVGPWGLHESS